MENHAAPSRTFVSHARSVGEESRDGQQDEQASSCCDQAERNVGRGVLPPLPLGPWPTTFNAYRGWAGSGMNISAVRMRFRAGCTVGGRRSRKNPRNEDVVSRAAKTGSRQKV